MLARYLASVSLLVLSSVAGAQSALFRNLDDPIGAVVAPCQALGDLNGDGAPDIVTSSGLLVNDGNGRFAVALGSPLATSQSRKRCIVADLNGDGLNDAVSILTAFCTAGVVSIDLNAPGTAFTLVTTLPPLLTSGAFVTPMAADVAAGDLDGDGDSDLFLTMKDMTLPPIAFVPAQPNVWLNNGNGTFTSALLTLTAAVPADFVRLADVDRDGDLDAILGGNSAIGTGSVRVLLNTNGVFSLSTLIGPAAGIYSLEVGDVNGDGWPDIVVGSSFGFSDGAGVVLGSASGFGTMVATPGLGAGGRPALVDLNRDGRDEVLWCAADISVHAVDPAGSVLPGVVAASNVTRSLPTDYTNTFIADLDGDLDRDVVAISTLRSTVIMNDGVGGLVALRGRLGALPLVAGLYAGDADGDGFVDVVAPAAFSVQSAVVLRNDGDGFFSVAAPLVAAPSVPIGIPYFLAASADVDADADGDIFLTPTTWGSGSTTTSDFLLRNTGTGLSTITLPFSGGSGSVVQAADLDLDGRPEILVGHQAQIAPFNGPAMSILPNIGGLTQFASPLSIGASHSTVDIDVADFNGDGRPDIFQTNSSWSTPGVTDPCVLYVQTPTPFTFTVVTLGFTGIFCAAGDLNGDALADIVLDGQVYFSTGSGFIVGPLLPIPFPSAAAELLDVDLDGDLDFVTGPATILRNTGGGAFGAPEVFVPPTLLPGNGAMPLTFDIDGDQDLDLVAEGGRVLCNTTRQIAHGGIARPGRAASIEMYGTPGGAWSLFVSSGRACMPIPPFGDVLIDPAFALEAASGTFAPAASPQPGSAQLSVLVPNVTSLVGFTVHWQAIEFSQLHLTNRVATTVMGY